MGKLVDVFAKRALVVVKGESVPRGVSDLRVSIDQPSTVVGGRIRTERPRAALLKS